MVIDFRGELDRATIKKAVALMSKPSLGMIALRVGIVLLIVGTVAGLIFSYFSGESISGGRVIRLVAADLFLGYFVLQPYIATRQLFKRLSAGDQHFRGEVNPTGIFYKTASERTVEYPWDTFYHAYKAEDLIVLATADFRTSILPRSLFTNEQDWQHFRQYVDSRVNPIK